MAFRSPSKWSESSDGKNEYSSNASPIAAANANPIRQHSGVDSGSSQPAPLPKGLEQIPSLDNVAQELNPPAADADESEKTQLPRVGRELLSLEREIAKLEAKEKSKRKQPDPHDPAEFNQRYATRPAETNQR